MPLRTQTESSDEQKRRAYTAFLESNLADRYCGYTTKAHSPVYLLDSSSYPLQRLDKTIVEVMGKEKTWNTFVNVPEPLVPKDDVGLTDITAMSRPSYEIPLETGFFNASFGPNLLTDVNNRVQTSVALANKRLVGLYFSAHWCGPCRSFTPMLVEMYEHLLDVYPTHGLEIVFVSGDRDEPSFRNYYQSMPWHAIPFDQLQFYKQALNMTYGVRGIPSLVVLDAVSGQVVVPASHSRQEVVNACGGGEHRIEAMLESWLSRAPVSTQELLSMLELSTQEEQKQDLIDPDDIPYLKRIGAAVNGNHNGHKQADLTARIKMHFDRLVHSGHDPNSAAATALKLVGDGAKNPGLFDGRASYQGPLRSSQDVEKLLRQIVEWNVASSVSDVLSTAQKYLKNSVREPWEPKFRSFKLSNKVADVVTRIEGGWALLETLGFEVSATSQDFMANIPVAADLTTMNKSITQVMEKSKAICK
jgi:nucleoredoxin